MHRPSAPGGFVIMVWGICCLRRGKQYEKAYFPYPQLPKAIRMAVMRQRCFWLWGQGRCFLLQPSAKEGGSAGGRRRHDGRASEGEALAAGLSDKRNPYIGDHIRDAALFGMLPVPETLEYRKMELQTTQEPSELIMVYGLRENADMPKERNGAFSNAVLLFASIENAGKISYAGEKGSGRIPCHL